MRVEISRGAVRALFLGLGAVLSACATGQQGLAHDDGDRLFLKYAAIVQHPAPATPEEAAEVERIRARISTSKDSCAAWKDVLLTVTYMELIGLRREAQYDSETPQARDKAVAELQR